MIPYDVTLPCTAFQIGPDHSIKEVQIIACNETNFGALQFDLDGAPQEVLDIYAHHFMLEGHPDGVFGDELYATFQEAWQLAMDDLDMQFGRLEEMRVELARRQHVLMGSAND